MQWLTIPQIKRRSKTAKGALKVSYEHWCQLYDATAKELREAYEQNKVDNGTAHCGLCTFYEPSISEAIRCRFCPLKIVGYDCYDGRSLYQEADTQWIDNIENEAGGDWYAWKRACKALRDKLGELLEQGD